MSKITLLDDNKVDELLALVSALPYVETAKLDGGNGTNTTGTQKNGINGRAQFTSLAGSDVDDDPLDREVAFFEQQHDMLVQAYLGQYIAMHEGKVISHHADLEPLIKEVGKTHPSKVVLYRQVQETLPPTLHFRSPRIVRD